jgi:hypothetical protein
MKNLVTILSLMTFFLSVCASATSNKVESQWFNHTAQAIAAGPKSCGDDLSTVGTGSLSISKEAVQAAMDDAKGRALGACQRFEKAIPETCRITKVEVVRVDMKRLSGGFQCFNSQPVLVVEAIALGAREK